VRRRARTDLVEPPARLVAYDAADWLPLVDVSEYRPDDWRNIENGVPVGPVRFAFEDWRRNEAWHLWTRARHDWCQLHGWPGGLDIIDLFGQEVRLTCEGNGRRG
jgi:hypothetical protein